MIVVSEFTFSIKFYNLVSMERYHSFSTYAKFSKKLIILAPLYAHVRVRIRGQEMLVFSENFAYVLNE